MRIQRILIHASQLVVVGVVVALVPGQGQAQTIEEIVVTAKQREESIQDVPLNITAFSAQELLDKNVLDVRDIAALTPSLSYYSGTGRADPTALVVRGLSANTSDERYQGLSIFVDGMAQSGQLTSIDTSDLERVEVLKGPQSATFGRATYAGAINLITKTPTENEISGRFRGQFGRNTGSDNNNHIVSARLNFPIVVDKLWASVNGTSLRRGAIGTNPVDNGPVGVEETLAFGLTLYAEPTDNLSIKFRYGRDEDKDSIPLAYVSEPAEWIAAGATTVPVADGSGRLWISGEVPDPVRGRVGGGEFFENIDPKQGGRDRIRETASLIISADVWNGHELTYSTSYYDDKYSANSDFYFRAGINDPFFGNASNPKSRTLAGTGSFLDGLFANLFAQDNQEAFENSSHQIRLVSPGEQRLRYIVGLYYFTEESRNFAESQRATATNPGGQTRGFESLTNTALFGNLTYDLTDDITVAAEIRVARDNVEWEECAFCDTTNVGNSVDDTRTHTSPRVTLDYRPNDDMLLYGYWSRGWKSARFNTGGVSQFLPVAEPEQLDNFEFGSKNTLWDGRALVNVAAYYMDIKDQQAFFPVPVSTGGNQTGVGNFGDSRVIGIEVDTKVLFTERLSVSAGVGYNDHEYTSDSPPLNDFQFFQMGQTVKGLTSVNTPKVNAAASIDYTFDNIAGGKELLLRSDVSYRSKIFVDRANLAYYPASAKFNAKAALSSESWTISLFANNVFDEKTPDGAGLSGSSGCLYTPGARCLFASVPRGREFGLEFVSWF